MKVKLQDVIDGMEMQFEEIHTYVCRRTGKVVTVSVEDLREAEWYQYRDECYKQKAIEWCKDHELDYE